MTDSTDDTPESLRYGMVGEDQNTPEEKLKKYTGHVTWQFLKPHYQSDSLYFVDPSLPLAKVGSAFINNEADTVDAWLKSGDLVKIEALHADQWGSTETQFESLVVSPFVLCRPVS